MKVTTRILGLAATAALTIGALGSSISVASADNGHQLSASTCGAPVRTADAALIDGIPTIVRADGENFEGAAMIARVNAESFDGVATIARVNGESFDGAAMLTSSEGVGFAGSAVTLQARDGSDCFPVSPGRAPEILR